MPASRFAALGPAIGLALAACSGAPPESPGAGATSAPPAATSGAGPTEAPPVDAPTTAAPNPGGGALNTAVVTIGEERYEVTEIRCDILTAGYIQAGNYGGDPEVTIVLPPDGWESQGDTFSPPSVEVKLGSGIDEQHWFAGVDPPVVRDIPEGSTSLDYSVPEGRPVTATGTGTFIDVMAVNFGREWEGVAGTFEVTCP